MRTRSFKSALPGCANMQYLLETIKPYYMVLGIRLFYTQAMRTLQSK